jgi:CheY-like chemotaxis protein
MRALVSRRSTAILLDTEMIRSRHLLSNKRQPSFESDTNGRAKISVSSDDRKRKPEDSGPAYRVVVVDDEHDIVAVLKRGLREKGFDVVGFTDPVEALSSFRQHQYDVVLLDIKMPRMNGIELYKRLRTLDSEVLICFLTAYENYRSEFEVSYPKEQSSCFIPKPSSIDRIAGIITNKMGGYDRGKRFPPDPR